MGVEVAAGVTAEVFDLVIEALGQVGGAQLGVDGFGVFDEDEVIAGAFFQVLDPSFVSRPELFQKSTELGLSAFEAAGGLDLAPGLFKGLVVIEAEVALSIAQ